MENQDRLVALFGHGFSHMVALRISAHSIALDYCNLLLAPESGNFEAHLRSLVFFSNHSRRHASRRSHPPYFPPAFWKGEVELSKQCDHEHMQLKHTISVVSFDSVLFGV